MQIRKIKIRRSVCSDSFKNKKYDKSQKYYLVAYDDKNDIEVLRHEIIMDIAFADDFGFFG